MLEVEQVFWWRLLRSNRFMQLKVSLCLFGPVPSIGGTIPLAKYLEATADTTSESDFLEACEGVHESVKFGTDSNTCDPYLEVEC